MSITDELRKYARGYKPMVDHTLLEIADRIDEAHESSYKDGYDEGFASADDWLADHEDAMDEHGWIELPGDDDGVPIRIGDTMEWLDGSTAEVIGIGNGVFFYKDDESDGADWSSAESKRHHHAPTVEDVLREFLGECEHASTLGYTDIPQDIFNTYTAKLRLAGDE